MIDLYFRAIPDANLLDTVCISMQACIFPAGSHKGVVFASPFYLSVSSLFLTFFFSKLRSKGTGYNRASCRENSRDATLTRTSNRMFALWKMHVANCYNRRSLTLRHRCVKSRILMRFELDFSLIAELICIAFPFTISTLTDASAIQICRTPRAHLQL